MQNSISLIFICSFYSIAAVDSSITPQPDRFYLPSETFFSAAERSMAGAVCAGAFGPGSALRNPSLLFEYRKETPQPHGSVLAGYGRDSLFDRNIIPAAISYTYSEGTIGAFYRYAGGKQGLSQHELTINLSGQLFEKSESQGPVDMGINLRFENLDWKKSGLQPLNGSVSWLDYTLQPQRSDSLFISDSGTTFTEGHFRERRIILDLGFYQSNVSPGIDFALVLRNLAGYRWVQERPDTSAEIDYDTTGAVITIETRRRYISKYDTSEGWTGADHRIITAGALYTSLLAGGNLTIRLPLDIDMYGLLDKKTKNRFLFRTGIEVGVGEKYLLRFGYARKPLFSPWDNADKSVNYFAGGAGLFFAPLSVDFYIDKNSWGLNTTIDF